jgi:hypothetical protein
LCNKSALAQERCDIREFFVFGERINLLEKRVVWYVCERILDPALLSA